MHVRESIIEQELIEKLSDLKYTLRPDIRDRAAMERNFREKFEALNRVSLSEAHIERIVATYRDRTEQERYSRRVPMQEIIDNDYNLNISRYVSTAEAEKEVDLKAVHVELIQIEHDIAKAKQRHNTFLAELGLPHLP